LICEMFGYGYVLHYFLNIFSLIVVLINYHLERVVFNSRHTNF